MDPPPNESGGAPDSWETADLDEAVGRLMLSSSRAYPAPSSSDFPADDDGIAGSASSVAIASAEGVVGPSDEAVAQVDQFLREALQNPRERLSVLRIEQDVLKFIRDPTQQQFEVPPLPTSYLRLAAHRVAQHYYLQSMVLPDTNLPDGSSSRILICKTSARCCLPSIRLADIPLNISQEERSNKQNVAIKQRPQNRGGSAKGGSSAKSSSGSNGKSVEERKEEYNKARARIFNLSNGPGGALGGNLSADSSSVVANHVHNSSSVGPPSSVNNSILEEPDFYAVRRTSSDTSIGGNDSQTGIIKTDKELVINRNKASNRVAIFRDLEVDRKDPDYNRSYDKYMQRFDPGFGFSASTYSMQPLYAPALNYNTEFPQLSSGGHRPPQVQSIEHHIPLAQHHVHGQWAGAPPSPNTIGYPPPETIMLQPSYSPGPVGAHRSSNMYHLHSSQYACPPRVAYVHPHEHIHQNFAQSHQQPDSSFGLARPR